MAEWSKAADCKSVRKLALVRIQFFSFVKEIKNYKTFYKDLFFNPDVMHTVPVEVENVAKRTKVLPRPMNLIPKPLLSYNFLDRGYNLANKTFYNSTKALSLNFSRGKFFPVIRTLSGSTYFFLSLGLLSKFLLKGKSFTKSKSVYLLLASFLRKVLLFSSLKNMYLFVNKTPLYFKEIMSSINDSVVSIYKNPFAQTSVNEKELLNPFSFPLIFFTNNKPYGFMKTKQKGRLKRKIARRITILNKVLD